MKPKCNSMDSALDTTVFLCRCREHDWALTEWPGLYMQEFLVCFEILISFFISLGIVVIVL